MLVVVTLPTAAAAEALAERRGVERLALQGRELLLLLGGQQLDGFAVALLVKLTDLILGFREIATGRERSLRFRPILLDQIGQLLLLLVADLQLRDDVGVR